MGSVVSALLPASEDVESDSRGACGFLRINAGLIENLGIMPEGGGIELADLLGEKAMTLAGVFVMCAEDGLGLVGVSANRDVRFGVEVDRGLMKLAGGGRGAMGVPPLE